MNQTFDVNEQSNVAGPGTDMAQRVMDCGDAGHILISKRAAEDLAPFPQWNPHLHDLGDCEVKHGRIVSLVNFYTDTIGNPEPPIKCQRARARSTSTFEGIATLVPAWIGAAILLILALAIAVVLFLHSSRSRSLLSQTGSKSIAVLPFQNLSQDPENAYFADGIQEEILTRLSKIADLKVISRTSTQRYKSAPSGLSEIAAQLGVAHILEGSVQKAADQGRVNVQLIDARKDSHVWADKFDRKLTDIFSVESEIATKIAQTLQAKLTGGEQKAITARPTDNTEAYELYLKGRFVAAKRLGESLKKSVDYFHQAIEKDPKFALAYAGLAESYGLLPQYSDLSPAECFPKARSAVVQALALDDTLAEAHTSLGFILSQDEYKFQEARREFERAFELNPNQANAHYFLGISVLAPIGDLDGALAEMHHALEHDPLSIIMNVHLGFCYYLARRYPEAIAQLHKTAELDPKFALTHGILGMTLEATGDTKGALAEFEKANEIRVDYRPNMFLVRAHRLRGQSEDALRVLGQMKELQKGGGPWAYGYAITHLAAGDNNKALDWLEESYKKKESGVIIYIKVDPVLDPLRGDPRFEKLANQIVPAERKISDPISIER